MFKIRNTLCPFNLSRWNEERSLFNCSSSTNVYHCLVDERNRSGEICIQSVWVQGGYCPEYNNDANTVDTVPCDWSVRCPSGPFQSYDVYQYPVCLNKTNNDITIVYDGDPSSIPWHIISLTGGIFFLLVVLGIIALLCHRKRKSQNTQNGKDEQIPLLAKEIPFYKTSTFLEAEKNLKEGGKILCLTGIWGSGRSTSAKQVYMSITGRTPVVIQDILNFDVSTCQRSVIVEEPLPRENIPNVEKKNRLEKIISLCEKILETKQTFVIITSTKEAWETISNKVKKCGIDENDYRYVDLNWKNLPIEDMNNTYETIFKFYNPDIPFSMVEDVVPKFTNKTLGFPEICTLFSKCSEFQNTKSRTLFFNRPLRHLCSYMEKMCEAPDVMSKFLVLVYMSLNNTKMDLNKSNDKLLQLFRSCRLNNDRIQIKTIMPWEFVMEEEASVYVLQHEIIKRMTLITFGKFYFSELLRFSSMEDLEGWIKHKKKNILTPFKEGTQEASDIEPFLEINDEQWIKYQEKMGIKKL